MPARPTGNMRPIRIAHFVLLAALIVGVEAGATEPVNLGTVRVHAWLGQPTMPPIILTRAPLQTIVERIEPERVRTNARAWEDKLNEHRQLQRAEAEARQGLIDHYGHELLIRHDQQAEIRVELAKQRGLLDRRFRAAQSERIVELRRLEAVILSALDNRGMGMQPTAAKGREPARHGNAAAAVALLRAEIGLARTMDLAGDSVGDSASDRRDDLRRRVLAELDRVGLLATDRLMRERSAQLQAIVLQSAGRSSQALKVVGSVLAKGVSWTIDSELRNRQGDLLLAAGRFAVAARAYGRVSKRSSAWYMRARLGLAWCRHRTGDDDGALTAIRQIQTLLDGVYGSRARTIGVEAMRLRAQILADATGTLRKKAASGASAALLASADGLRRARTVVEPAAQVAADDSRLMVTASKAPALRDCYRAYLTAPRRQHGASTGRVLVLLTSAQPPRVMQSTVSDDALKACVTDVLTDLARLPDDPPALVALELSEVIR